MQSTITLERKYDAVSSIDGNRCVNCGQCESYCPTGAIYECQKEVCHLCPDCTEKKPQTVSEVKALLSEACTLACPLGISPQGYINLLKAGKKKEAFDIIYEKTPLPSVCGYVCHHPCEDVCKRGTLVDEPMHIRALKRYLGEAFIDEKPEPYPVLHDKPIAVIGGGPAGLTAAHWLAKRGYPVTVFEQAGEAGGMLLKGIPDFRVNKEIVRKEIKKLEEAGIEFVFNTKLNYPEAIDQLRKDYDKIVVAVGTQISKGLPIEGWQNEKIYYAVNLMEKVNSGVEMKLSGNGVVIGGGSVAMDVARTALRLGADKVTCICLECGAEMPAHQWEIEEAKEEGVELISGVAPLKYLGWTHKLEGVEYAEIENFDPNTFKFDVVQGTNAVLPADFVIVATGQRTDKPIEGEDIVYAGDIAGGPCSVIDAMASGRLAAIKIDNELSGREYKEYDVERELSGGDRKYRVYPAVRVKAPFPEIEKLCPDERIASFELVEQGMNDEDAFLETYRCLSCGYRAVDEEKCIGCGVCQKVCPKGDVITMIAVADTGREEN